MTIKYCFFLLLILITTNVLTADAPTEKEIYEEFALSPKREDVLKKLIPGTEIYFFLNTLYFQQNNKIKEADDMILQWGKIFSASTQLQIMKNRQTLLNIDNKQNNTYSYIKENLYLNFDYGKPISFTPQIYPDNLSPEIINVDKKIADLLLHPLELKDLSTAGLYEVSKRGLTGEQLQILLNTYPYPDLPNMTGLILQDFKNFEKRIFGDLATHNTLTLNQLNELKEKMPTLLTHEKFVFATLSKLNPENKQSKKNTPLLQKKYLLDCWAFVKDLNPSFNNLKANILYAYLNVCLVLNQPDFILFKEYIKLPRNTNYANLTQYQKRNLPNEYIVYNTNFKEFIQIAPIDSDEKMIEAYLFRIIKSGSGTNELQPYFEKNFFNKFEAETKIMTGLGKPEDYYQILQPDDFERLKNSVEISFTEQNQKYHLASDAITLYLQLKNIKELEIQIYKLNTLDYYRLNNHEINEEIPLEGYMPNFSRKIQYNQPSTIKHQERIDLSEIDSAGVYIIELFGNGIKTRTFIRKGNLYPAIYDSNEGQEIQLFDDNQNKILDYTIYFGKHQLKPNKSGIVMIPYTTIKNQEVKKLIFLYKDLTNLFEFQHRSEAYELSQIMLNQPESIIPGQNCAILIKPILFLNNKPIELSKIKDARFEINFFNHKDELLNSQLIKPESLKEIIEIKSYAPETATYLTINISGTILKKADDEKEIVSTGKTVRLIGANSKSNILGIYLRKQNNNFQIECLNKAGIPQANVSIQLKLFHQYFSEPIETTLQTNQMGIITLNQLPNFNQLYAKIYNNTAASWYLKNNYTSRPRELTALENEPLEIPFRNKDKKNLAESLLLLKIQSKSNLEIKTAQLILENDILKIPTDTAGEYILQLKNENESISIHILKGKKQNNYYVSEQSITDIPAYLSHQIALEPFDEKSEIIKGKIINPHEKMKVFMWSGRYFSNLPNFMTGGNNYHFQWPSNQRFFENIPNHFFESIKLSDEQNYILNRRDIKKFPGNLLMMPSTLLNPWDTSGTDSMGDGGGGGGSYGTRSGGGRSRSVTKGGGSKSSEHLDGSSFEFLPNASIQEIITQKDGSFEITIKDIKDQRYLQIGVISPYGYTIKELALASKEIKLIDIRQQKNNSALEDKLPTMAMTTIVPDKPITFSQGEEKRIVSINTMPKLHSTLTSIIHNQGLSDFDFLGKWQSLTEEEKLNKYQEFACHELHFFIFQKDKKFFTTHIKPFLKNKQAKTFIDNWLLEDDLSSYLSLNNFNQLNLFEKILLCKKQPNLQEKVNKQIKEYLEMNKPNRESEIEKMEYLLNTELSNKKNIALELGEMKLVESNEAVDKLKGQAEEKEVVLDSYKKSKSVKEEIKEAMPRQIEPILDKLESEIAEQDIRESVLYRDVKSTKEYAEANYFHMQRQHESIDLIKPSQFWLDYLNNTNAVFVSENILAFTNIHEAILALALTDLPDKTSEPITDIKGNQITITTKTPLIVLLKSFKIGVLKPDNLSLQQHYYYQNGDEKKVIAANKNPFFINKKYNCLTVITNTTAEPKEFYLNLLIPEGSIPLDDTLRNKQQFVSIQPYTSFVIENHFFFPKDGSFSHLPAKAVDNENIFTNEKLYAITATADEETLDKSSWEYLIKEGNKEKILAYIKTHNLLKTDYKDIYYLLKDRDFFNKLTAEFSSRFYFDFTTWSYAVYHQDKNKLAEFLPNSNFANSCGAYFSSLVLTVDPLINRTYEHKEYWPLIKGRSHPITSNNKFENAQLETQYDKFIEYLTYKPTLNNSDYLNLTIYTLNQLRIDEAIQYFSKITDKDFVEKLQYDYLKAYLAFYQEDLATAEKILATYKELSIVQWKEKFVELEIQLNEIKTGKIDEKTRGNKFSATVLAEKEAVLKTKNNLGTIEISYKNLKQAKVDYYQMDLEILFSNAPFEVLNNEFKFLTIPNVSESITFNEKEELFNLKIPDTLKNKNLVIKVSGAGKESIINYYPTQLDITISENYGELRVLSSENKKPLSGVYVKVYGKNENAKEFVKDGYTDLRGVFNYTSVSGKPIHIYDTLAILVLSEKYGASIHYTASPAH